MLLFRKYKEEKVKRILNASYVLKKQTYDFQE